MTQDKFDKLVNADILRLQGVPEETIIQYLNTKNSNKIMSDLVDKIYWTGSPEIHPFKDDEDWNNDNDKDDEPKSDYERNYEDNQARQYE